MTATTRSTIGDLIRRSARRVPQAMALTFEDRVWTYRQLDEGSDRVAAQLLALGLKKGDRVAAFGKNSDAYVLLWFGVLKAGLVHVPVNFALVGRELSYLLRQSGARMVFADDSLLGAVESCGHPVELRGSLRAKTLRRRGRRIARRARLGAARSRSARHPPRRGRRPKRSPTPISRSSSTPRARPAIRRGRCSPTARSSTTTPRR